MTPELIGILAFLAFGSTIAAFFNKARMGLQRGLGLGHTMSIKLSNGQSMEIENISVTLHNESMRLILASLRKGFVDQGTIPAEQLDKKCAAYLSFDKNNSAQYAVNTFKACAKGYMNQLMGMNDTKATISDFDDIVNEVTGIHTQDGIPNLKYQYQAFFDNCPPKEDEFIIGHADRLILTNERMVITSEGTEPRIAHDIPIKDIASYSTTG